MQRKYGHKKLTVEDEEGRANRVACHEGKGQPLIILDEAEMSDTGGGQTQVRCQQFGLVWIGMEQTRNVIVDHLFHQTPFLSLRPNVTFLPDQTRINTHLMWKHEGPPNF